jgi:hypothetical protein
LLVFARRLAGPRRRGFGRIWQRFDWLELVRADGAYDARAKSKALWPQSPRWRGDRQTSRRPFRIHRPAASMGRRTNLSWFVRNRRLAKDYDNLADTLAALISLACIEIVVRRLGRP